MAALAGEKPFLLMKKLGGLLLLILGLLLTAVGFNNGSIGVSATGIILLVAGAALLALKIVRRNNPI